MKTYIQIGAYIGNDDFHYYIDSLKEPSYIILIEPNISCISWLQKAYERNRDKHTIDILNIGIVPEHLKCNILHLYPSPSYDGRPSYLSTVIHRKSLPNFIRQTSFVAKDLNHLLIDLNIKHIELLNIDTEGLDAEILLSLNTYLFNIQKIIFEEWEYDNDDLLGNVRTGNQLITLITNRFNNYSLSKEIRDGMSSYILSQIKPKPAIVREVLRICYKLSRKFKKR